MLGYTDTCLITSAMLGFLIFKMNRSGMVTISIAEAPMLSEHIDQISNSFIESDSPNVLDHSSACLDRDFGDTNYILNIFLDKLINAKNGCLHAISVLEGNK